MIAWTSLGTIPCHSVLTHDSRVETLRCPPAGNNLLPSARREERLNNPVGSSGTEAATRPRLSLQKLKDDEEAFSDIHQNERSKGYPKHQ